MSKSKKGFFIAKIAAAVLVVGAVAGGISYYAYQKNMDKMQQAVNVDSFYTGIKVNEVDLSGLTMDGAKTLLEQSFDTKLKDNKITLVSGEKSFDYTFADLGAKYDVDTALTQAYEIGREGGLKERYQLITDLAQNPQNIEVGYSYDESKIREQLQALEQEVKVDVQNSTMKRENGAFTITDEKVGYDLNVEETLQKVKEAVESKQSSTIEMVMAEHQPTITKAQNQKATDLIGSFYTTFSSGASTAGRNENLRVGCANINGTVLAPGEVFSTNKGLGPQTYANGYRNAAVIVNGKIEDGLAGGVCQITTTLYNAVIFAELDVVERRNHSLSVAYVPLGRDAAVAGDYTAFKFKNNTEYPLYIETYLSGNQLIANIYGHEVHDPGRKVEFEKVFLSTIQKPDPKVTEDPNLPEGQRVVTYNGKTGSKVSTYKKVFQNGELLSREWFSDSTYKATPDEVSVGTKKAEAAVPAAKPQTNSTNTESQAPVTNTEPQSDAVDNSSVIGAE